MANSKFKYLRPDDIRKLSNYEFAPKFVVEGYLAGRHRSHSRGLSTEFRDYRQYSQGDDPATLDWRVYARTDRYYVRTYEQETNTCCYVFLDSSASMGFGSPLSKLEYSSFFTAALCYLVTKSDNLVGLQVFDESVRDFYPPGSTRQHLHNLMHVLESNYAGNKTSLAEALRRSVQLLKRRGTLIVISDFFDDPAAIFQALSPFLHRGFKIHLFHVLSPEEIDLPDRGLTEFVDMENQDRIVAHTDNIKRLYRSTMDEHVDKLRALAVRRQIDYVLCSTATHYFTLFDRLTR